METRAARRRDGRVLVVLAVLLAVLNVLLAVIAPFVLTIPTSAAATAVGAYTTRHTEGFERRIAIAAAALSFAVLVLSLELVPNALE